MRCGPAGHVLSSCWAASPTCQRHRWGAGGAPAGSHAGKGSRSPARPPRSRGEPGAGGQWLGTVLVPPTQAVPALPPPPCPGSAGSWANDGVCPLAPGCERRGRLLPPSKTGPAGRGASLPQPARPHLRGLSGPRSHPAPARPDQLLRVSPPADRPLQAGPPRARQVQEVGAPGGTQGTWRSRSSGGCRGSEPTRAAGMSPSLLSPSHFPTLCHPSGPTSWLGRWAPTSPPGWLQPLCAR